MTNQKSHGVPESRLSSVTEAPEPASLLTALEADVSPERALAVAVLTQAITEAKAGNAQARAYVTHQNRGFDHWCAAADLDADWLREQVRGALDGHGPRVRTSKIWSKGRG